MKGTNQFKITESDGGYVAEGVSVPIVTQGDTLDELTTNIREAVGLYEEDNSVGGMIALITKKNQHNATDWGDPVGREVW